MIISASRRTDIPRYFSEWFVNRIREGTVVVRNPINRAQIFRIPLSSDGVDCIVFWTKDPQNMLPHLETLDKQGYNYYFQYTITCYDHLIEPNLRPKREIVKTFIELSNRIGKRRVVWRYDPILRDHRFDMTTHQVHFQRLCETLSPYTDTVIISFVELYRKIKSTRIHAFAEDERAKLSEWISHTAKQFGLCAAACCEEADLTSYGIERANCIDQKRIEQITGDVLDLREDKNQRAGCGCSESIDIGAYDTCEAGCIYCYANRHPIRTRDRMVIHDPKSELLNGTPAQGETILDKPVKSNRQKQMRLI